MCSIRYQIKSSRVSSDVSDEEPFVGLSNVRKINLSYNALNKIVPNSFPQSVREVILDHNRLKSIPRLFTWRYKEGKIRQKRNLIGKIHGFPTPPKVKCVWCWMSECDV